MCTIQFKTKENKEEIGNGSTSKKNNIALTATISPSGKMLSLETQPAH